MITTDEYTTPAPPLNPHLTFIYSKLPDEGKRLFRKAFVMMWDYLLPKRYLISSGAILQSYWCIDQLRIKAGLNTSELAMLIFIYEISEKGNKVIHSKNIFDGMVLPHLKNDDCKRTILHTLKRLGYIIRMTRNPQLPYLSRSIARQPVFIQMTPKGIGLIYDIGRDLYRIVLNTSYNTLIGANSKS